MGPKTNSTDNGILLRSDIHTLFDLGKIGIDLDYKVIMSDDLYFSIITKYIEIRAPLPEKKLEWPNKDSIKFKLNEFNKSN